MEEIDLTEVLKMFYKKKFLIISVVLLFAIVGAIYSFLLMTPKYKATTKLVLTQADSTQSQDETISSITQTDVNLNQKLVSTYGEIVKSSNILTKVIDKLPELKLTESGLRKNITVNSVEDTSVIEVSVSDEKPENAAIIANEIAEVFSSKIADIYKINNIYTLDKAKVPTVPYNINHVKYIIMFAAVGFVLACAYIFIANMFDNTAKNKDEIEKLLGVPVLVSLTIQEESKKVGARK